MSWLAECLQAMFGTVNQRVRGQAWIEGLTGTFYTYDGQGADIEQAELNEHTGLIPVDMLMGQLQKRKLNFSQFISPTLPPSTILNLVLNYS